MLSERSKLVAGVSRDRDGAEDDEMGPDEFEVPTETRALCGVACTVLLFSAALPIVLIVFAHVYDGEIACPDFADANATANATVAPPPPPVLRHGGGTLQATPAPTEIAGLPPPVGLAATIGLRRWMVVHGAAGVGAAGLIFVILTVRVYAQRFPKVALFNVIIGPLLLYAVLFFRFAWLVVGTILFWRDCRHARPLAVRHLMWVALIIDLVALLCQARCSCRDGDDKPDEDGGADEAGGRGREWRSAFPERD